MKVAVGIGKFILYIGFKVVLVIVAAYVAYQCFMAAINSFDINFTVREAFARRAIIMLQPESADQSREMIERLCTESYIVRSGIDEYMINSTEEVDTFYQRTDVEFVVVWEGDNNATVEVTDKISSMRVLGEMTEELKQITDSVVNGVYDVSLVKDNDGTWLINDIVMKEVIDVEYDLPEVATPEPTSEVLEEETA